MKRAVILAILAGCAAAYGGAPQPCIVVHGLVRDAFGYPYVDGVRLVATRGDVECAQHTVIGMRGGENYVLELEMDSGGTRYAEYAVQRGDRVDVLVLDGGEAQPLVVSNRIEVAAPGVERRLDLWVGQDADHDGLSDAWELDLIAQSGGVLTTLEDVDPAGDFDGDGLSNLEEFMAGTFAFLATDVLKIQSMTRVGGGRIALRFLSSRNQTYRVAATTALEGGEWLPVPVAIAADQALAYTDIVGDGGYVTVYVDASHAALFLRLVTR